MIISPFPILLFQFYPSATHLHSEQTHCSVCNRQRLRVPIDSIQLVVQSVTSLNEPPLLCVSASSSSSSSRVETSRVSPQTSSLVTVLVNLVVCSGFSLEPQSFSDGTVSLWCWKSMCQAASVEGNNSLSFKPHLLWLCTYKLSTSHCVLLCFFLPARLLGTERWCWKSMCQGTCVEGNNRLSFKPHLLWLCTYKLSTSHCVLLYFFCQHGSLGLSGDAGNPCARVRV